jgi:hypothetical protein
MHTPHQCKLGDRDLSRPLAFGKGSSLEGSGSALEIVEEFG